jgi:two-component system response regulator PilR (NtrC family)/two-component system response regulator AtoC
MTKLLIVDDEGDIREFAKHFFQKRGIDVVTVSGGQEALESIGFSNPDLVLLDVRMGDMTGVDVLKKLRDSGNQTKVIMVTGVEDPLIIKQVQELGVCGYVHKPLALEELERVVMKEIKG